MDPVPEKRQGLADAGMYEVVQVYEALMIARNIDPRTADEMYLYECAVALGVGREESKDAPTTGSMTDARHRARALNRARLAHARGEGPAPEVRSIRPEDLEIVRDL